MEYQLILDHGRELKKNHPEYDAAQLREELRRFVADWEFSPLGVGLDLFYWILLPLQLLLFIVAFIGCIFGLIATHTDNESMINEAVAIIMQESSEQGTGP